MLTSDIFWDAERAITKEYNDIEFELFSRVIEDLCKGEQLDPLSWRVRKLQELSKFSAGWQKTLEKLTKEHYYQIAEAVIDGLMKSARNDNVVMSHVFGDEKAEAEQVVNDSFQKRLTLAVQHCMDDINLTNTQAISSLQKDFLDTVNSAYVRTLTGTTDLTKALRDSVHSLASRGVTIQYQTQTGKIIHSQLDVAVRRNVVTTLNQTATEASIEVAEKMGTDLVEVSAHSGARPSHAVWQGGIYSLNGKTKGYRTLAEATGYGTPEGLCGPNCRHTFWPYFPGFSKQQDHDDIPGIKENNEIYKRQQQQRAYERKMRECKREYQGAKISGDETRRKAVWHQMAGVREEYLSFLDHNGLTRFPERERI